MKRAFFMKHGREQAIRNGQYDLLLHPKKLDRKGAAKIVVSYEDVTKDSVWLDINARIAPGMRVAFECPSRYPKITSQKVQFLQRLSFRLTHLDIYDVVPFTLGIEYLYTPFSYLGRELLGFPHWYAFREHYDIMIDGVVMDSLSPEVLGPKVAKVATFSYGRFSAGKSETVLAEVTAEERAGYLALKEKLFETNTTPAPVVTALADYSHACQSRIRTIADIAKPGDAVFCNLQSYATKLQKVLPKGAKAYSYAKPPQGQQERVIIAEPSIANDYQQFDAEALADNVVFVRSDLPVDSYLHGRQDEVRKQIDDLTRCAT